MAEISIQTPSILFYFPNSRSPYRRMQVFDKPQITYNGKVLKNDISKYKYFKVINSGQIHPLKGIDAKENEFFYIGSNMERLDFKTNDSLITFNVKERSTPVLNFTSLETITEKNRLIIPSMKVLREKEKWRAYCKVENQEIQVIEDYRSMFHMLKKIF